MFCALQKQDAATTEPQAGFFAAPFAVPADETIEGPSRRSSNTPGARRRRLAQVDVTEQVITSSVQWVDHLCRQVTL